MNLWDGKHTRMPGGRYDTHILLLQRWGMDALTVDAQDAAYIDELLLATEALGIVEQRREKRNRGK